MTKAKWTQIELDACKPYAGRIFSIENHISYYKATKELTPLLPERTTEAIWGKLKQLVNDLITLDRKVRES